MSPSPSLSLFILFLCLTLPRFSTLPSPTSPKLTPHNPSIHLPLSPYSLINDSILSPPDLSDSFFPSTTRQQYPKRCPPSGPPHVLQIAIAYDNTFCALNSGSESIAAAYIQGVVNTANAILTRDACVRVELVHLEPHCKDPFDPYVRHNMFSPLITERGSLQVLRNFQTKWKAGKTDLLRDVAFLLTGYTVDAAARGSAFVGGTCAGSAYAWVFQGDLSSFVHEVGHVLGCTHTGKGIMRAPAPPGEKIQFSSFSMFQIDTFLRKFGNLQNVTLKKNATCVKRTQGLRFCDVEKCPGKCIRGECVVRFANGMSGGLLPCSPLRLAYYCVTERYFAEVPRSPLPFKGDCPQGVDFVLQSGPGQDVFCCRPPSKVIRADIISKENEFSNLTLSFPDGTKRMYPDFITDRSLIMQERLLIRTSLVPTCGLSDVGKTTTTTPPPPMATKATTKATTKAAKKATTTTIAKTTAKKTASGRTTCGSAMANGQTFQCARTFAGYSRLPIKGGLVSVQFQQRSGLLTVWIRVTKGITIQKLSGIVSTRADVNVAAGVTPTQWFPDGVQSASFSVKVSDLEISRAVSGCCGQNAYAKMVVRVCNFSGLSCVEGRVEGRQAIQCVRPCPGRSVLAMAASRACPRCFSSV